MGGSTKSKSSSTSTYTPNSTAMSGYTGALDQGQQLADTPFNYDTTKNVAGFNPQQMQSFNQIGQMQGMFAPYVDAASGYTSAGAGPITGAQIQNYQNPFQQQVIDATMANINHQNNVQQRDLIGNVAGAQGLGNNRAGIMQAELARGQGANTNSTIANLLSGGFNTALGAAQQDSTRQLQAGNQMAQYGALGQNLALQGSQALNQVGNQQQGQLQNMYDTASGNEQAATMWPYQNAQFQAMLAAGLGPLMGGTTTGNSTTKQTSNPGLAGYVGGGLSLLGALANGGRVGYADGGSIDMSGFSFPGMALQASRPIIPSAQGAAPAMSGGQQSSSFDPKKSYELGKSARSGVDSIIRSLDPAKGWGSSIENVGGNSGGFLSGLGSMLGFADGGALPTAPRLAGSSYIPAPGSVPGAAGADYYAPGIAALAKSRGPQMASPMPTASPNASSIPSTGHGKGLGGADGMLSKFFGGNQGASDGIASLIARLQGGHASGGAVRRYDDEGTVDYDPFASFGYDPNVMNAGFGGVDKIDASPIPSAASSPFPIAGSNKSDMMPPDALSDPMFAEPTVGFAPKTAPAANASATPTTTQDAAPDIDPLDFIKREEGYAARAKWDRRQYSGGFGSKAEPGETFTPEKAEAYLRRDAAGPLSWVQKFAPNAPGGVKAALVSLGYNAGEGSLNRLKDDVVSGNWESVANRLPSFNKALNDKTGKLEIVPALTERRKREAELIRGGDFGAIAKSSPVAYPSPSGGDALPAVKGLVAKGMDPEQPQASKSYENAADKHSGGLLKRLFGIDFNPLNLDRDERMALITAGLGMMSTGNIGSGGLMGMESLQNSAKTHQDAAIAAQKLAMEFDKTHAPAYKPTGSTTAEGHPILYDAKKSGKAIDAVTGEPVAADVNLISPKTQGNLDDESARAIADRYVTSGNRMELSGLGQGNIGSANRAKVQRYIREISEEKGVSSEELANRQAEWEGRKAGQRSLGTQEARMGSAANEADQMIKLARGTIEKVPRTKFLPFNQLVQMGQKNLLDPNQAELFARTQAVVNTYSAVMARGANVTTDSSRHRAEELLTTAMDSTTYNRVLDTLQQEIDAAKTSPAKMREFYRKEYGKKSVDGDSNGDLSTQSSGSLKSPPKVGDVIKGHRFKGGNPSVEANWELVQ